MKRIIYFLTSAIILVFSGCEKDYEEISATPEVEAAWSSCDAWAKWSADGYTLYNNKWGKNAGWQCIWANNGKQWGVSCNHGSSGGIKSYPNSTKWHNKNVNSTGYAGTWVGVDVPSSGAYTSAFDVWANGKRYEIMMWINKKGDVSPIGSRKYSRQSIGGHTWDVYQGWNGSIEVFSFVRTSNTNSGSFNHKAIWSWLQNKGWWGNPYVGKIQFGFEITNTSNRNLNFVQNGRSDWDG